MPNLQVRDLQAGFFNALSAAAPSFLERYGAAVDNPELNELSDELQTLLGDKDAFMSALQVSYFALLTV
jgi:hypothetical protein